MNHIVRRFLTPLLVMFLAGLLAGCYTLLKHSGVTDDWEGTPVVIILDPWPIRPPLPPPPPPPPRRHEPPPTPPVPPTRPIDPKQPEKPATQVKEKESQGKRILKVESTETSRRKEGSSRRSTSDAPSSSQLAAGKR